MTLPATGGTTCMSTLKTEQSWPETHNLRLAMAGACALFIAMGVGRFAYTPILPLMQSTEHFSNAMAGYLAASNYLGYLVGAFMAGATSINRHRAVAYHWGLGINIITTGLMAATANLCWWLLLRLISGISSGMIFVLVSSMVLDSLAPHGRSRLSGLFFSGVGLGIVVTGIIIAEFGGAFGWKGSWLALMIVSVLIGIPAVLWIRDVRVKGVVRKPGDQDKCALDRSYFPWLLAAYGCEGMGYIITGTFLVTMVANVHDEIHRFAPYCWIIVGIAAFPSCIAWSFLTERKGAVVSLVTAYILQAIGIILPAVAPSLVGIILGFYTFRGNIHGYYNDCDYSGEKLMARREQPGHRTHDRPIWNWTNHWCFWGGSDGECVRWICITDCHCGGCDRHWNHPAFSWCSFLILANA